MRLLDFPSKIMRHLKKLNPRPLKPTLTLTVTGSEAIMRLDYITQDLSIEQKTETVQPRTVFQEPLKAELLQHFVDCIIDKSRLSQAKTASKPSKSPPQP